jgi:type I restriction enzyme S subunit
MPRADMDVVLGLDIVLPSIDEQRQLVDILSRAEGIVRLRREAEANAKEIIPALFIDMFGDPESNKKGLPVKTLGELVKVKSGDFLPAKKMDAQVNIPVYGGNGINGYHSTALFEDRKIVIGRVGAYCGNVHITSGPAWITDNALYVAEQDESIGLSYLAAALRQARLNRFSSQAGQPLISAGRIYPVPILVPPMGAQQSFEDRARLAESIERQLSNGLLKAEATFAALLSHAFATALA